MPERTPASAESASPACVSLGSIFIDDIVKPDGQTHMGVLGGGSVHAAAGAHLWGVNAGIAACVGEGFPTEAAARLRAFDLRGVVTLGLPQVRAWQIFEWDGLRTEVFRVRVMEPFMTVPRAAEVADAYAETRMVHVLRGADDAQGARARFPHAHILWEPNQHYMKREHRAEFARTLAHIDIVSPNLVEAQVIYGDAPADVLAAHLLADGARVVALRLGEAGSLLATPDGVWHIPAVPPAAVIDQTGAGNTFCGGFMAGWLASGGDACEAALYGAVSASFALETLGVLAFERADAAERDRRLAWARAQVQPAGSAPHPTPSDDTGRAEDTL